MVNKYWKLFFAVFSFLFSCCVGQADEPVKEEPILHTMMQGVPLPKPEFKLKAPGAGQPVDYAEFGEFFNEGTPYYRYVMKDIDGLKNAVGEGIYPNEEAVTQDPLYLRLKKEGKLKGRHWDFLKSADNQSAFFVWAQASESAGVKTFFTGMMLERAGLILPALKAYDAALVHFPTAVSWAADKSFVWYIAPAAIASIKRLCRDYPDLNLELVGAKFEIKNGEDTNLANDVITVSPGRLVTKTLAEKFQALPKLDDTRIIEKRGQGRVHVVKFSNGHWQLRVDGKPFFVRGITYSPTEVGIGPASDPAFMSRWMFLDKNQNGKIDAPYDAWVDVNGNHRQDRNEPAVGDFQLLKDMGINAIRLYVDHEPKDTYAPQYVNKDLLRAMYKDYGIMVVVGDFLGAYTVGSGATWEAGTDYTDLVQRQKMKEAVRAMVLDLKDEPFVLMWLLGNENNMPGQYLGVNATRTNVLSHPEVYAKFLDEVAMMIHELDPDHPVAVGNIETGLGEYYAQFAPQLDIWGINSYRGSEGFGMLWQQAREKFDRPILITEYGCDAYSQNKGVDEDGQVRYHQGNFRDLVFNQAGGPGEGNALGGVIFEYLDEWWKDTQGHPETEQQYNAQFSFPFPDGFDHEEWLGIVGQGKGKNSPFERHLRKAYFYYKNLK